MRRPIDDLTMRSSLGEAPERDRLIALWDEGSVSVTLPANGRISIGRAEDCDLRIDHPSVSRYHAALHVGTPAQLEDLGSSNGTRIAGRRLEAHRPVALAPETLVRVGDTLVVLRTAGEPLARPPPVAEDTTVPEVLARFATLASGCVLPVIILGETGVGKGVLADAIHRDSSRASAPLVRLNCAALPEALLESELFGHERGAFTGAVQAKPGLLEAANGGTLLLDEVGELPPTTQAKLLHVLEHGEVLRLGSLRPRKTDVRFIAATNRDLDALLTSGRFRDDLFFRLAGLTIKIPPLRERREEIPAIARALLDAACGRMGKAPLALSEEAVVALVAHPWPGNVRELKNAMARVALLAVGSVVGPHDLGLSDPDRASSREQAGSARPATGADPMVRMRHDIRELEKQRIVDALARCAGSQTRAAEELGISRRTLTKRLGEFGLARPRKAPPAR